ncbi:MAG: hypothetical protein IPF53_00550 [Blastocatellia bacterium]|nr:hypothetical protein [Blastocatellia bacterium]
MRAFIPSVALLIASVLVATPSRAATTPEILKDLPAGDGVIVIEPKALFGKVLPAALAGLPEYRGKVDAAVASMNSDFGLDLANLRSVGVSLFVGADATTSWVAVMKGDFAALAAGDALAAKLDVYSKTHPRFAVKKVIHEGVPHFVLPETTGAGVVREDVAVALLDESTAAYGTPSAVRRAIDVRRGAAPSASTVSALTDALALADPAAPLRLGMPVPQALIAAEMKRDPGNPFLKTLSNIRLLFATIAASSDGAAMKLTARASTAEQTESVAAVLSAIIGLGQQATATKPELAALFDRMTVTTSAPDATLTAKF